LQLVTVTFSIDNLIGPNPATTDYQAAVHSNGVVQNSTDPDIGAGLYEVTIEVDSNPYYTTAVDLRTISVADWADRDSQVTGSGDVDIDENEDTESDASFGFHVEYGKKHPNGYFTFYYYVDEDDDDVMDYEYIIKNNSWARAGLIFDGDEKAYFESKATVKKIRLSDGENVGTSGNGKFYVEVLDNSPDEIAVAIWDGREIAFEIGTLSSNKGGGVAFDGVELATGEIVVIP